MKLEKRIVMGSWTVALVGVLIAGTWGASADGTDLVAQTQGEAEGPWAPVILQAAHEVQGGDRGPAWLDDDLRRSLEAGEEVLIDEIDGFPFTGRQHEAAMEGHAGGCGAVCPSLPYTHIRPGAALGLSQLACTANFVFENGDRLAIGTAGHCTQLGATHQTLLVNAQQAIGFRTIGATIFSTGNGGAGTDFALIEIGAQYHDLVQGGVSLIDGPCGWGMFSSTGSPVQGYGHGLVWGAGGQPRSGFLLSNGGNALVYALAPGVSWGDSGSPAIFSASREAAAVTTHAIPMTPYAVGTSIPRVFELLGDAGHAGWELVDSPNCL